MGRFNSDKRNIVTKLMIAQGIDKFEIMDSHVLGYRKDGVELIIALDEGEPAEGVHKYRRYCTI